MTHTVAPAAALNLLPQVSLRRNTALVFSVVALRAPRGIKVATQERALDGHTPCECTSSRSLILQGSPGHPESAAESLHRFSAAR